jgi:hypothetical protein
VAHLGSRDAGNAVVAAALLAGSLISFGMAADGPSIDPAGLPRVGSVDPRFQSYNIEMVEVTGGRFWKPYQLQHARPDGGSDLYAERAPIDLANPRLRRLAAALAPAYLRVSGTWANSTYVAAADQAPATPPAGFNGVLTRQQWRGVIGFSQAVDARLVTSFAISAGARDATGAWTPDQARRLIDATRSAGGRIAAAEFMNEPDLPAIGGAPAGYDAAAYARDFSTFRRFAAEAAPDMKILGPGTVSGAGVAADLLAAAVTGVDVVSYHFYGALSERCHGAHSADAALSEAWLAATSQTETFYRALRDRFAPGKPIWLTETADAACGGSRWGSTFLDTFRYLDQLGRLARAGVAVVMHNTLAASDYGLLDETSFAPRPNYWAALLWRRLMGETVLDAGRAEQSGLHVYAHCAHGVPGGVTLLVINPDRAASRALRLAAASQRYALDAASLQAATVRLNGRALALGADDELPALTAAAVDAGLVTFAPATITFLAVPAAGNEACRE